MALDDFEVLTEAISCCGKRLAKGEGKIRVDGKGKWAARNPDWPGGFLYCGASADTKSKVFVLEIAGKQRSIPIPSRIEVLCDDCMKRNGFEW